MSSGYIHVDETDEELFSRLISIPEILGAEVTDIGEIGIEKWRVSATTQNQTRHFESRDKIFTLCWAINFFTNGPSMYVEGHNADGRLVMWSKKVEDQNGQAQQVSCTS